MAVRMVRSSVYSKRNKIPFRERFSRKLKRGLQRIGGTTSSEPSVNDIHIQFNILKLATEHFGISKSNQPNRLPPNLKAQGSYGCVFNPPLSCIPEEVAKLSKPIITKLMDKAHAQSEIFEYDEIYKIDPTYEFHLLTPNSCLMNINIPGVMEEILRCKIDVIEQFKTDSNKKIEELGNLKLDQRAEQYYEFVINYFKDEISLLVEEDGGDDLMQLYQKGVSNTWTLLDKIEFLLECRRLLVGCVKMDTGKFHHMDLKPENIVYRMGSKRINIIDFGLSFSSKDKDIKTYYDGYRLKMYHYNEITEKIFLIGNGLYYPKKEFDGSISFFNPPNSETASESFSSMKVNHSEDTKQSPFQSFNYFIDHSLAKHFFGDLNRTGPNIFLIQLLTLLDKTLVKESDAKTWANENIPPGRHADLTKVYATGLSQTFKYDDSIMSEFLKKNDPHLSLYDFLSTNEPFQTLIVRVLSVSNNYMSKENKLNTGMILFLDVLLSHHVFYKHVLSSLQEGKIGLHILPLDLRFKIDYYEYVEYLANKPINMSVQINSDAINSLLNSNEITAKKQFLDQIVSKTNVYQTGLVMMFVMQILLPSMQKSENPLYVPSMDDSKKQVEIRLDLLFIDLCELFYNMMHPHVEKRLGSQESLTQLDALYEKYYLVKPTTTDKNFSPVMEVIKRRSKNIPQQQLVPPMRKIEAGLPA